MPLIGRLKMYGRFTLGLRGFLKEPITLEQTRVLIRQRLQNRGDSFLLLMKRAVYGNKTSPYLKLLNLAGCEYGDIEERVKADGIENTLKLLAVKGVYLSNEEFKGKKDVRRSGQVFQFRERDFDNPLVAGHFEARSSGSRSTGTRTIYDFDHIKANLATFRIVMLDVYNGFGAPFAIWAPIMPGGGPPLIISIEKTGITPARWFSPVEKSNFHPSFVNRFGTYYIVHMGRLAGANLPAPEYVSLEDAWKVTDFISAELKAKGRCCLHSYPSLAVRVCRAAKERGISLEGAVFFCGGEPVTEAKRKEITSTGASVCPIYVFTEGGFLGAGCRNPAMPDDVHFFKDAFSLIQHPRVVPHAAATVDAFLISTLLSSAPKILVNVESGDWGVMSDRKCGCKFEEWGLTDHLYNIRGFDKLTGEGMTFVGTDLLRLIEEVLPQRFGGGSTDYQIIEEEDVNGQTHMSILVSPHVGSIAEKDVISTVLAELGRGKDTNRMMADVWAQAGTLRIKRQQPIANNRGKLLPLHINTNPDKK
jgi:hypothetical protein